MLHASLEIISAIQFLITERFADKRRACEICEVGDRFEIISGPYEGVLAEAVRIKTCQGVAYLYARNVHTGENLPYPICFARQIRRLN